MKVVNNFYENADGTIEAETTVSLSSPAFKKAVISTTREHIQRQRKGDGIFADLKNVERE